MMSAREMVLELRDGKKMTQRELARMLGVMPYVVSKWVSERAVPSDRNWVKLSALYEILRGVEIQYAGQARDYAMSIGFGANK